MSHTELSGDPAGDRADLTSSRFSVSTTSSFNISSKSAADSTSMAKPEKNTVY